MSKPNSFRPFDWVYWYALGYRTLMRLSHRYGWHYTGKAMGPFEDGSTQLWCRWCGLRQTTPRQTLSNLGGDK